MKISVIIPIFNALQEVIKLLESLKNNFNFELGEILLINDYSSSETTAYLKEFCNSHNSFKLINNSENLGFIKSCNRGMKEAKGDIIVLLNSDTIIPQQFCERIIKCFESDSQIGTAAPIASSSCWYYIPLPLGWSLEKMNKTLEKVHKCTYPLIPSPEGFCFCIRRAVIEQQGYLDEIYGKGYHEEVDFAYRAITNGWKNVLIDNMYVYHKRHATFGKKQRNIQIEKNNPVFFERWNGFWENYIKENNIVNPIKEISKELGIRIPDCEYNFAERIFSIKNSKNHKYKIINIFGLKIRHRKGVKFPKNARNIDITLKNQYEFKHKRAVIFAGFNAKSEIDDNTVKYLTELKKVSDFIIFINDNPLIETEIAKIENIVDAIIAKKHGEYDFGSYKRGYFKLKKLDILNKIDKLLICNDSVKYVGNSLKEVFEKNINFDFYGITQHGFGYTFDRKKRKYVWIKSPHIQSYFMEISKDIFNKSWFEDFFKKIHKKRKKVEIIINYEQGFSNLITSHGFKMNSFYPATEDSLGKPEVFYNTNKSDTKIFIKKSLIRSSN